MTSPSPAAQIRILLVEDHPMVRRGLRDFLGLHPDLEVVGEVATAIRSAAAGEVHFDPSVAGIVARRVAAKAARAGDPTGTDRLAGLTPREGEVLALVARGRSNREIAIGLAITERTAGTHVSNILAKLALASRTQAALLAAERGLGRES